MTAAVKPLEGIRVLDLTRVIAGPIVGRTLAYFGADVIKVESLRRIDAQRIMGGSHDDSPTFNEFNAGKRSLGLDLTTTEAQKTLRSLVAVSDVVVENYSPRIMENFGLTYLELKVIRPDVILLRMPGMGLDGPYKDYVSFGQTAMALSGLTLLSGYPDMPAAPSVAYVDYYAGVLGAFLAMAAIERRRAIGEGGEFELAQLDAGLAALGGAFLRTSGGAPAERRGNAVPGQAPHGVFATKDGGWLAIAVYSDDDWSALAREIGEEWSAAPGLQTLAGRESQRESLERRLSHWVLTQEAAPLEARLQVAGVAAAVVQNQLALLHDSHLAARSFYETVHHPRLGALRVPGSPIRLAETPGTFDGCPGPILGGDTRSILSTLLDMDDATITDLISRGVAIEPESQSTL